MLAVVKHFLPFVYDGSSVLNKIFHKGVVRGSQEICLGKENKQGEQY